MQGAVAEGGCRAGEGQRCCSGHLGVQHPHLGCASSSGQRVPGQSTGLSLPVFFLVRCRAALLVAVKERSQLMLSKDLLVTRRKIALPEGQRIWAAVVKPEVWAEGV